MTYARLQAECALEIQKVITVRLMEIKQDLVRMAMSTLRQNGEKITVQAVAELAGLSTAQVVATMRKMADSHERSERNGH